MYRIAIICPPSPNYEAAVWNAGMEPVPLEELGSTGGLDALILPGGDDIDPALYHEENVACRGISRERDLAQLHALELFVQAGKPVLGICRGIQVLNVFFGGTLIQDIPEGELHRWNNGDSAHTVITDPESALFRVYGERYRVNSAHHQAVGRLGEGLRAVQHAEDGIIEAVEHCSLPILGVQWHPERMSLSFRRSDTVNGELLFQWLKDQITVFQGCGGAD